MRFSGWFKRKPKKQGKISVDGKNVVCNGCEHDQWIEDGSGSNIILDEYGLVLIPPVDMMKAWDLYKCSQCSLKIALVRHRRICTVDQYEYNARKEKEEMEASGHIAMVNNPQTIHTENGIIVKGQGEKPAGKNPPKGGSRVRKLSFCKCRPIYFADDYGKKCRDCGKWLPKVTTGEKDE